MFKAKLMDAYYMGFYIMWTLATMRTLLEFIQPCTIASTVMKKNEQTKQKKKTNVITVIKLCNFLDVEKYCYMKNRQAVAI